MSGEASHVTVKASVSNHSQVTSDLDKHGQSGSKLWNVANWTARRIWDETGSIPEDDVLKAYLKGSDVYCGLHSQSSQRVLEELAEAFESWYAHRRNGNTQHNPPGYRKHHRPDGTESHPRSTITWKQKGFKHDAENNRVRLSKGKIHKEHPSDFLLCEYEAPPGKTVQNVQTVRAVYTYGRWELHFVCQHEFESESPGEKTAGVDLGIVNFAAVSINGEQAHLYPGNALKEDEYYFEKEIAKCNDSASRKATRLQGKRRARRSHYIHAVTKHIIDTCIENDVGTLRVGNPKYIREDEAGEPRDWGPHGNLELHAWPFDAVLHQLKYKGAWNGITVDAVDERGTSKTCSCCSASTQSNRVERGLYVCGQCGVVANADANGAENIRCDSRTSNSESSYEDRSTGWLAQPVVNLFRRGERGHSSGQGTFTQHVNSYEP